MYYIRKLSTPVWLCNTRENGFFAARTRAQLAHKLFSIIAIILYVSLIFQLPVRAVIEEAEQPFQPGVRIFVHMRRHLAIKRNPTADTRLAIWHIDVAWVPCYSAITNY